MNIDEKLSPYFQGEVAELLAAEDFVAVLDNPTEWSKELHAACLRVVWKWDLGELRHLPWDRSDGCKHYLHLKKVGTGEKLEAQLFTEGEKAADLLLNME